MKSLQEHINESRSGAPISHRIGKSGQHIILVFANSADASSAMQYLSQFHARRNGEKETELTLPILSVVRNLLNDYMNIVYNPS